MKRFELNFDEDKVNDVLDEDGASYDLKECCKLLNEQQADLVYLAKFIGEFKVEKFKLKLRNLRMLEDKVLEQQATIEMYQRRVHKREEQISIIKKHCLKFLTDEQFEVIRKELENG